jgi:hypothetical protein
MKSINEPANITHVTVEIQIGTLSAFRKPINDRIAVKKIPRQAALIFWHQLVCGMTLPTIDLSRSQSRSVIGYKVCCFGGAKANLSEKSILRLLLLIFSLNP